jgi:hypothetical protein
METRRRQTEIDIKEINDRIHTVLDKVQESELRLMQELKSVKAEMLNQSMKEREALEKLGQWKWMIIGGILATSWLISHTPPDSILTLFTK